MKIETETLMSRAVENAKRYRHKYIRTEHLLLAVLDAYPIHLLAECRDCIQRVVAEMPCPTCDADEKMELSTGAQRAFEIAQQMAVSEPLEAVHLVYGIVQSSITVQRLLETCDVDVPILIQQLESEITHVK